MVDTPYSMVLDELERLGVNYKVERGGKHYKFYFAGAQGEKRILVTSATPTGVRAIKNALALLKRMLREKGKDPHVSNERLGTRLCGTTSYYGLDTRFTTNGITEDIVVTPLEPRPTNGETEMDDSLDVTTPLDDVTQRVGTDRGEVDRADIVGGTMSTTPLPTVGKQKHTGSGMAKRAPYQEFCEAASLLGSSEEELAVRIGYSVGAPPGWRKLGEIPLSVSLALKHILDSETRIVAPRPRKLFMFAIDAADEKTQATVKYVLELMGMTLTEVNL